MERSRVHEDLQGSVKQSFGLPTDRWWGRAITRKLTRFAPKGDVTGVTITQTSNRAPAVRVYRPDVQTASAALFWIHGGGMIIGEASLDDRLCASTARELGIVVVSAEYRLAPEHPFPIPLDDCYWGWQWLQENAESLGVDPALVVVGGQSAGGGLAAGLVQRLADAGGSAPIAQWLFCPMIDDRTAARRELDSIDHWVWDNSINRFGWRSYLGAEPGGATAPPYAAPARREDLQGLPQTWLGVGDIDLFHDEDLAYGEALRAAGVDVTFEIVPGAPHGFEAWAPDAQLSRDYVASAQAWLHRTLKLHIDQNRNERKHQ